MNERILDEFYHQYKTNLINSKEIDYLNSFKTKLRDLKELESQIETLNDYSNAKNISDEYIQTAKNVLIYNQVDIRK